MKRAYSNYLKINSFIVSVSLLIFLFSPVIGQNQSEITIKVKANQSIRSISEEYLGDPDLWEDILRANSMESAADVKPGITLRIPVQDISNANRELSNSLEIIQNATKAGAKIFTPEIITEAINLRDTALEKRKAGDWVTCTTLAKSSSTEAKKALEISIAQQDVSAEAVVHTKKGNVQKRKPSEALWNEVQIHNILNEGERIRTLSQSYLEILFRDDSRLRLNENSQAFIQKMRANLLANTDEASISLIEGDVLALLSGKKKENQFNLDITGVETNINSKHFWVEKSSKEAKFANYEGELEIAAAGEKVVLKENQGSIVKQNQKPTAPQVLLPKPILKLPNDGIDIFDLKTHLTWEKVQGSKNYLIEIAKDVVFSEVVATIETNELKTILPEDLGSGLFFWWVRGVSTDGIPGQFSESKSFRLVRDDKPPFLVVKLPEDGTVVSKSPVLFIGSTESGARLTIGKRTANVDTEGNYRFQYALTEGVNEIEIEARDPAGNISSAVRAVTYLPGDSIYIFYDASIPTISQNHFLASTSGLALAGMTVSGSTVSIEMKDGSFSAKSIADEKGNFRFNLPLTGSQNEFSVRVVTLTGFSKPDNITVQVDDEPPRFSFPSAIPATTSKNTLVVKGTVIDGLTLYINGKQAVLDNGQFEETLSLQSGVNHLQLSAKDKAGNVGLFEKEVFYDPDSPSYIKHEISHTVVTGGEKVTVKVWAEDATGYVNSTLYTIHIGKFKYSGIMILSSRDGQYSGDFRVPKNIAGPVILKSVTLKDHLGNSKEYRL